MALGNCLSGPSKLCGKWMLAIEICMKDAFKEEGMCVCLTQIFPWYKNQTHRIHVWYIYLHLLDFYGKCRCIYIYHTWIHWEIVINPGFVLQYYHADSMKI